MFTMPRTGENIYRRKDGRWEGRYVEARLQNGKTKYRSVYGKTYKMVRQKLGEAERNRNSRCADVKRTYMEDLARLWSQSIRIKVKESTYARYQLMLDTHILPCLGTIPAEELTTDKVENYLHDLLTHGRTDGKGGLSFKTVNDNLGLLKELMQFAQTSGIVSTNTIGSISLKQEKREKEILSEEDRIRLISGMSTEPNLIKTGILLSLYTGLRIGELCALRWSEIDLSGKILYVKHTAQRIQDYSAGRSSRTKLILTSPKSKSSNRCIPLPNDIVKLLKPWEASSETFFLSGIEEHFIEPRRLQIRFKKYLKEYGIREVSFHCLRHTFSTACLRSGMDSKTLSELLGHSNVNITLNLYVHTSLEYKRESMNKMILFR
jgi:integrase